MPKGMAFADTKLEPVAYVEKKIVWKLFFEWVSQYITAIIEGYKGIYFNGS